MEDRFVKSSRGKLERAKRLLDDLERLRNEWLERFEKEGKRRERQYVDRHGIWTITEIEAMPSIEDELSQTAGDAVHNTRSALDHLACACVSVSGNPVTDKTAFPIRKKQPGTPFSDLNALEGMEPRHVDFIERLQPYSNPGTPEARKLIRLGTLDNIDKHHMHLPTHLTCIGPAKGEKVILDRRPKGSKRVDYVISQGGFLHPGDELVRIKAPLGTHAWVPLQMDLAFGHGDVRLAELHEIRAYVVGITESFGPVLDVPPK